MGTGMNDFDSPVAAAHRRACRSLVNAAPDDSLRPVCFHRVIYSAEKWQSHL
jgi:hypothetical protein